MTFERCPMRDPVRPCARGGLPRRVFHKDRRLVDHVTQGSRSIKNRSGGRASGGPTKGHTASRMGPPPLPPPAFLGALVCTRGTGNIRLDNYSTPQKKTRGWACGSRARPHTLRVRVLHACAPPATLTPGGSVATNEGPTSFCCRSIAATGWSARVSLARNFEGAVAKSAPHKALK